MKTEQQLEKIRDFIASGEINRAFEELKKLSKEIDDKQLKNHILLNCFSYYKNYNAELLNLHVDKTAINRAVLKTLELIDDIEERLIGNSHEKGISAKGYLEVLGSEELPLEAEKKIDIIVEKHFGDLIIDKGDLYQYLSRSAITFVQFESALRVAKEHFDFFKTEFLYSSGLTLSNLTKYAFDVMFVPEDKWLGSINRKKITSEFKKLIQKENKSL